MVKKSPALWGKSEEADRGKWAEKEVNNFLKKFNTEVDAFDWQRMPDARAARGALAAQVADFEFFSPGMHGALEVKEIKHATRLPKAKLSQVPRLRKRQNAGGVVIVLIYHSPIDKWRMPPPVTFFENSTAASWDLSDCLLYDTAEQALRSHGAFQ